jgi:hypothetical protein
MQETKVKDKLSRMNDLLQELMPEELESRLELQVLVDPMSMLSLTTDNNNNKRRSRRASRKPFQPPLECKSECSRSSSVRCS